jgi:hypothetical protein
LGIPATVALRQIVVVQGKPTCSAELMLALVHRTYGQSAMRVYKTDNESCTVQYRQQGWDGISDYSFTIEDAKRAGLLKNQTWTFYPAAMLRARAISATVRFAFPECLSGLYLPEELGADVTVVDGAVVPIDSGEAPASTAPTEAEEERAVVPTEDRDLRDAVEDRYRSLAHEAVLLEHPRAERIASVDASTLTMSVLSKSIAALETWIADRKALDESEAF